MNHCKPGVVNCFQNTILVWNSQVLQSTATGSGGCELLSEYYLSMEFTGFFYHNLTSVCCELLSEYYLSMEFTGERIFPVGPSQL